MISASGLVANCGYQRLLKRNKPRSEKLEYAAGRGTTFHASVERWVRDGIVPLVEDLEIQGWIDLLASQWTPPPGIKTEIAWGLSPDGDHVMVQEPRPHEYESMNGRPLLTAGRADAVWPGIVGHFPCVGAPTAYVATVYVIDWKTGKWPVTPARENLQANAGGIALAKRYGARAYVPGIYYARDGYFDWGEPVELGSIDHAARFVDVTMAAELDETPRPGEWCYSCWERRNCTAAQP